MDALGHNRTIDVEFSIKTSLGDLVTDLDRRVEQQLRSSLESLLLEAGFIGEESGPADTNDCDINWIVDPIDATTNVVHGLFHAALSVALYDHWEPVLGVIYNPFTDTLYYAVKGAGAWARTRSSTAKDCALRVSRVSEIESSLVGFGLPYDRSYSQIVFGAAASVFSRCQDLRRRGSACLDIVSVAEGHIDGYFEAQLRSWDLAAAVLILEEAGGKVTSWSGLPLANISPTTRVDILISNNLIHDELARTIDAAVRRDSPGHLLSAAGGAP